MWLYAPRLYSVAKQNRAKPRAETVARTIKRLVWLERRPALAVPAGTATVVPAALPAAVALPLTVTKPAELLPLAA